MRDGRAEGASHRVPVSRCLSTCRRSLLGHQIPAGGLGLPHGRLTGRRRPDPDGGYRVSHARAAIGVGASCVPRTAVLIPTGRASQPAPAASQRPVPVLRYRIPSAELTVTRHRSEVQVLHPSDLPLACGPRMERAPLGFCLMLRTPPGTPATHARPRPGHEHGPGTTPSMLLDPPINVFTHMRATSRRKPVRSSPRPRPRDRTSGASAFPRASHPAVTSSAHRGRGQAIEHRPETTLTTSVEPPILRVHSMRATSRRTAMSRCASTRGL
jgi:hypothetical protein